MAHNRKYETGKGQLNLPGTHSASGQNWYVFYLRPRTENRVFGTLIKLGYEVFLPVVPTISIWKNRQKRKILRPLFSNYLFVYTCAHELYPIKSLPHVVTYLTSGGKPSTISVSEVEGIRRMLGLGCEITVETKYSKGERVRIVSGPLKGHEGVLVEQHSKTRFGIQIKSINHVVFIDTGQMEMEKL